MSCFKETFFDGGDVQQTAKAWICLNNIKRICTKVVVPHRRRRDTKTTTGKCEIDIKVSIV